MKTNIQGLVLFFLCSMAINVTAQDLGKAIYIPIENEETLINGVLGGLDNPQISTADINADGVEELVIFDKNGLVFNVLKKENNTWKVDKPMAKVFPLVKGWVLLRDYDNDGVKDLFCYSTIPGIAGVSVFKGSIVNGQIAFTQLNMDYFYDVLYFLNGNQKVNLYVSVSDIPAIVDVDGDGDLDILTFETNGSKMDYYKNQSVEEGFGLDSLLFERAETCWGKFVESGIDDGIELGLDANTCATAGRPARSRHAGSTVLGLDLGGDGDIDLMLGDASSDKVKVLYNTGTNTAAYIGDYDLNIEAGFSMNIFNAAFYEDVDFDGRKDVLVAPNAQGSSINVDNLAFFKNTGSSNQPSFDFQNTTFITEGILDLGSYTAPTFVDANGDGLLDIVVGADGILSENIYHPSLVLLLNNGTAESPSFELSNSDYLSSAAWGQRGLAPHFADLDGDNDLDLICGTINGTLIFGENTSGSSHITISSVIEDYMGIDVGQSAVPSTADMDGDGVLDLIIGEKTGILNFYKNNGTLTTPNFNADITAIENIEQLGDVDTRVTGYISGYSQGIIIKEEESATSRLLSGSHVGQLFFYEFEEYTTSFEESSNNYGAIYEGERSLVDLADIDNDTYLEMVVGNVRGGLSFYETSFKTDGTVNLTQILPNDAITLKTFADYFIIELSKEIVAFELYDVLGRKVRSERPEHKRITISKKGLSSGAYILVGRTKDNQLFTKKMNVMRNGF